MRVFQPGDDASVTDVVCVDFESKLRSAVSLSNGGVQLWDADTQLAAFTDHAGPATALALHPERMLLASVGEDKSFILYDVAKKEKLAQVSTDNCGFSFNLGLAPY